MMSQPYVKIRAIEVKQPIGNFYIGKIDASDLIAISYADVRRIEGQIDNILGIQRELSPKRVKELTKYVQYRDATFPTSIILSINSDRLMHLDDPENMTNDEKVIIEHQDDHLMILREENVAKIIDGYHRIAGLRTQNWAPGEFELNVTIFVDMDPEDEAIVFSTINKQQTKPPTSLSYDLFELAKTRSPQKTSHNIARLFNSDSDNPFYRKIKLLGKSYYGTETISQATFVECVMAHISSDPYRDRDDLMRGRPLTSDIKALQRHVLRQLFINSQDETIALNLANYFEAVRAKWRHVWDDKQPSMILNRTTGFVALMRFFKHAVLNLEKPLVDGISVGEFNTVFQGIQIADTDLNKDRYKPGGNGIAHLFRDFREGKATD